MRQRLEVGVNKEMQHWRASVVIFMKHYGVKMPAGDPLQTDTQDLNLKPCHCFTRDWDQADVPRFKPKKVQTEKGALLNLKSPFLLFSLYSSSVCQDQDQDLEKSRALYNSEIKHEVVRAMNR